MKINKGDIIKAFIEGKTKKGKVFFSNKDRLPIEFRVDSNFFLKGIENVIIGMKKGEVKNVDLSPDESFGYKNDQFIKTIPRCYHEQNLKKGDTLSYFDYKNSRPLSGTVIKAFPKTLIVDFNHPLCGESINYNVEIVDIIKNKYPEVSSNNTV